MRVVETGMLVVAVGARGPMGMNARQLAMSVRAAKMEPRATSMMDKREQRAGVCYTGGLSEELFGYDRFVALAIGALTEACLGLSEDEREQPLPMIVVLPEPGRPDDDARFRGSILDDIAMAADVTIDSERSAVLRGGYAGMAAAAVRAAELLDEGAAAVLLGGVDSYYHPDVLRWLDEACRLHALGAENGFIPSEGAAFMLLSRRSAPGSHIGKRAELGRIERVACGQEATLGQDSAEPNTAETLTELIQQVCAASAGDEVRTVISDSNGERHRVRELTLALHRAPFDITQTPHRQLLSEMGDVGAASGAMAIAIALAWWASGHDIGERALVLLQSEGAARGVIDLQPAAVAAKNKTGSGNADPGNADSGNADSDKADSGNADFDGTGLGEATRQAGPYRASAGVPQLHRFERAMLAADKLGRRRGGQDNGSILGALAEPGSAGERAQLRRILRDCLEEIGALGNGRRVRLRDEWAEGNVGMERRMLAALDAVMALARSEPVHGTDAPAEGGVAIEVLDEIVRYGGDHLVPDVFRAFARVLSLCCVPGRDCADVAVSALLKSNAYTHDAQRDAFVLASSPAVDAAMTQLAGSEQARWVRFALDVLIARGTAPIELGVTLCHHPEAAVRLRAARMLAAAQDRTLAVDALQDMLADEADDAAFAEALSSLLLLGAGGVLARVRERLEADLAEPALSEEGRATLLMLLGLAGSAQDGELLLRAAAEHVAGATALGWHGDVASVPPLIELLDKAQSTRRVRLRDEVARALYRISGRTLLDEPAAAPPAEPEDEEAESTRRLNVSIHATRWRAFWDEQGAALAAGSAVGSGGSGGIGGSRRLRLGRPYQLKVTLDELAQLGSRQIDRRLAALELMLWSERAARVSVTDWAVRQWQVLDTHRRWLERDDNKEAAARAAGWWRPRAKDAPAD